MIWSLLFVVTALLSPCCVFCHSFLFVQVGMSDEYPRIRFQTEMEAYVEFTEFVDARFDRLGREFTLSKLNDICRLSLRLSRLMLRSRQYLLHLRGLVLLQSRQHFLMTA